MNKKFISALLFGAMLFAPASMFVSCSYDDDIAELRGDLDATKTDLSSLVDEKMKNVDAEIASLGAQADALETAYEAADEALQEAIANATNDAKGYADVQAAQAQVAAIAAAQKMVSDAQVALETALAAVNTTIGEHGKSISALLEADKQLTSAIAVAQARADQAYALAEQAQKLATDNAAAIKSLNEALEGLKKTVANLEGQVSVLGEKVTALEKEAQAQAAEIAAQKAALKALEESNAKALDAAVKAAKDELLKEIEANSKKVADLEDKLAAAEQAAQAAVDAAKIALEAQIAEVAKNLATLAGESAAYTDKKFDEALKAAQAAQAAATDALDQLKDLASKTELEEAAAKVQAAADAAQAAADDAKAALEDLVEANAALAARITALEAVKDAYKDADAALEAKLQEAITNITKDVAALKTELEGKITEVNANLVYQGKKLKSLVFSPELYYQGIEAVGVYSFNYIAYKPLTAGNLEVNQAAQSGANAIVDSKVGNGYQESHWTRFVPNEKISYIMNPSNAVVSTDVANYGFIVNNAKYTRAAAFGANNVIVKEVVADKNNGKLTLTINMTNPERIAALNTDQYPTQGNVDVMALKYTDKGENGDTTIISDFAAIKHYYVTDFTIRSTAHRNHPQLAETPFAATTSDVYFTVAYDGKIDLKENLDVHYSEGEWGDSAKIAEKNFRFEYELMGYIANDQTGTNESKHAKLTGSVVIPQNADGSKANRSAVGRTPLVRVKLIDGNNGDKVVAVGYTLVKITDVDLNPISFAYGSYKAFEVVCDEDIFEIGYMPTWSQFEQEILSHEKVQLSKSDFHALYKLDVDGNNVAKQFNNAGNVVANFGSVTEIETTTGDKTNVLKWTVDNTTAYNWFKNGNGVRNTKKQIIVRFVPKNEDAINHRPVIYLTLTWTPADIEIDPFAGITDNDKVNSVWYAADSNNKGYSDLHAHVDQTLGDPVFKFGVDNATFRIGSSVKNVVEVVKASLKANGYNANNNALAGNTYVEFKFAVTGNRGAYKPAYNSTAGSAKGGNAYNLTVNDDRNMVYANGQPVAELKADGAIEYKKNDVTKDILNYAHSEHLAKGQSLTLQVEVVAKTCDPATNINLSNNKINVKFIRPLNLEESNPVKIVDSQKQTQTIKLGKGEATELIFTDWRGYDNETVYEKSGKEYNSYKLYNITKIYQDTETTRKVQSDFVNGTMADIDESLFTFTYSGIDGNPVVQSSNQGTITYEKKTSVTVHDFKVRIPVIVEYSWGKMYGWINVEVDKTDGNN